MWTLGKVERGEEDSGQSHLKRSQSHRWKVPRGGSDPPPVWHWPALTPVPEAPTWEIRGSGSLTTWGPRPGVPSWSLWTRIAPTLTFPPWIEGAGRAGKRAGKRDTTKGKPWRKAGPSDALLAKSKASLNIERQDKKIIFSHCYSFKVGSWPWFQRTCK